MSSGEAGKPRNDLPEVVADFDPKRPLPRGLRVTRWEPNRSIRIVRRFWPARVAVGTACALVAVLALVLRFQPDLVPTLAAYEAALVPRLHGLLRGYVTSYPESFAAMVRSGLIPVSIVAALLARWLLRSALYRCEIDLMTGEARIRLTTRWRRLRTSHVAEVVLREVYIHGRLPSATADVGGTSDQYGYRLELSTRDGASVPLMKRTRSRFEDTSDFDALYPLAAALARALHVPHRFDDSSRHQYPGRSTEPARPS